jgi:hypothetical protein
MTREEALEIKKITDQCIGTIPGQYVDFIWEMYIRHIEPSRNRQSRPCTCTGRYWTGFLFSLKDKVTDTLRESEEILPNIGES